MPRPLEPSLSVVIPTLNEADNLPFALSTLADFKCEIIVVDGRSKDDTVRVATALQPDVVIIREPRKGKGAALQSGFAAATGDIIVMLDADGSADGREIPRFVEALRSGADFAKGTRFANGGGSADITSFRFCGNWGLNKVVNVLFGSAYSDLCYGYNAFWRDCLPHLAVDCDGFEVETLMTIRAIRSGLRIAEVPSYESARIHGSSNLRAIRDGLRVARTIGQELQTPAPAPIRASSDLSTGSQPKEATPRHRKLCLVAPGQHAPVIGVVSDHELHSLSDGWQTTAIQLSVPDDPYDWTLLGLNTPSLVQVPHITEVASRPTPFRVRRVRRFLTRHAPDVVLLDWWSLRQAGALAEIAATANSLGIRVAVRMCGRFDEKWSLRQRAQCRRLFANTELLITQGFTPKIARNAPCPTWKLPEWKTEDRQVDPEHIDVLAFLPSNNDEAARHLLDAIAGLSQERARRYRLEIATSNRDDLTRLRSAISAHHHSGFMSLVADHFTDHELHYRMQQADIAIVFDPDVASRALQIAEVRGIPVVVVREIAEGPGESYCGAAVSPPHAASILGAIERADLARRFRYPDSERWLKGANRLSDRLAQLVDEGV